MVRKAFCVAGLPVQAEGIPAPSWAEFARADGVKTALAIEEADAPFTPAGQAVSVHGELIVHPAQDGGWLFCSPPDMPPAQVHLLADRHLVRYHLPPCEDEAAQRMKLNHLLRTAMECVFCDAGIVSLHAACVEADGEAVAFTGHSGLGKSTRAAAWAEALEARWISGDRPAIRMEGQGSTACGVPWDGKEQIFRDAQCPLRCIMEVRRSPENYIRRLSADQKRQLLMQQTFVPMWDTDAAVKAMANVRRLVQQTPVYRVFCGPTVADARVIHDVLMHHPEMIREEANDMKIKDGFVLRNVVDEFIVMPTGDNIAKFEGAVVLNEISAFIFKQLENPVSRDDLLSAVLNAYDVDEGTAAADLDALLDKFADMGLLA